MANWDATSFGNDDAADFADLLSDGKADWDAVSKVLSHAAARSSNEIDIQLARTAVAAAELVAAAMGRPPAKATPYDNDVIVLAGAHTSLAQFQPAATAALDRVLEPTSALRKYWNDQTEPEYRADWERGIADLKDRLSTTPRPAPTVRPESQ